MKMVGALTKQNPHAGALGSQTLSAAGGYSCAGLSISFAHAGTCGRGTAHFSWAPLLKKQGLAKHRPASGVELSWAPLRAKVDDDGPLASLLEDRVGHECAHHPVRRVHDLVDA